MAHNLVTTENSKLPLNHPVGLDEDPAQYSRSRTHYSTSADASNNTITISNCDNIDDATKRTEGHSWVIAFAVFLAFVILGGLHYTTSIFYVALLEHFGQSYSHTAWLGSLSSSCYLLAGPLASCIISRCGARGTMFCGATIMAGGYCAAALSNTLTLVIFFYGVVVSLGMCLCYTASVVVLTQWFCGARLAAVTSYSMTGSGLGIICMSYALGTITESEGWRVSFLFCGAVSLQLFVLGSLYFKRTKNKKKISRTQQLELNVSNTPDPKKSECDTGNVTQNGNEGLEATEKGDEIDALLTIGEENGLRISGVDGAAKSRIDSGEMSSNIDRSVTGNNTNRESVCSMLRNVFSKIWRSVNEKSPESSIYRDPQLWLTNLVTLLTQMATLTIFLIYKDLMISTGLEHVYSLGMSLIGFGDLAGRFCTGIISSYEHIDGPLTYSCSMLLTAVLLLLLLLPADATLFLSASLGFGFLFGVQNVYLALMPTIVFGHERLALVLGQNFFWGGVGALFGPPIAGYLVDRTGVYTGALVFTAVGCLVAALIMMLVYFTSDYKTRKQLSPGDSPPQKQLQDE